MGRYPTVGEANPMRRRLKPGVEFHRAEHANAWAAPSIPTSA